MTTINTAQLRIVIGQVLRMVGGTGCPDYSADDYIYDVLSAWRVSESKFLRAMMCFEQLKATQAKNLAHSAKISSEAFVRGRYSFMCAEANSRALKGI